MKLLVIDEKNVRQVYAEAGTQLKKQIEEIFPKELISGKITDRVKTFEDACAVLNIDIDWFDSQTQFDSPDELAFKKMKIIVRALNEGWTPNWDNSNERKWFPWFYLDNPSGFRFGDSLYAYSSSHSAGGSRLCFKTEELCNYAAKQFLPIYKDLFN